MVFLEEQLPTPTIQTPTRLVNIPHIYIYTYVLASLQCLSCNLGYKSGYKFANLNLACEKCANFYRKLNIASK